MGTTALVFLSLSLYALLLCWGRQWNVLALLVFVELAWVSLAGGFGLLSLYLLDLTWLYLTALVAVLSGVELVLSLFAFISWHRVTGQSFVGGAKDSLR